MDNVFLNKALLERNNVSKSKESHLVELHKILTSVIKSMNTLDPEIPRDLIELKESVKIVESLEYMLQCSWNFDIDKNYHSWWYRLPHCKCPVMDNGERVGTPYRIHSSSCPLHHYEDEVK